MIDSAPLKVALPLKGYGMPGARVALDRGGLPGWRTYNCWPRASVDGFCGKESHVRSAAFTQAHSRVAYQYSSSPLFQPRNQSSPQNDLLLIDRDNRDL